MRATCVRAANVDAAAAHLLAEIDADVLVEPAQDMLAPDDLDDLAAEPVEDAGELDRDIAAADDDDALWQGGQVERLVRRDHMLDAGDLRRLRPAADRDQDVLGGEAPPLTSTVCGSTTTPRPSMISTWALFSMLT